MNVYDCERMTEALSARGYSRNGRDRERRSRRPQHLPHPREGRREGLFGPRPHPRDQGGAAAGRQGNDRRGGGLRRAGRGRRDRAPRAGRRSGHRPAELSSAAASSIARHALREPRAGRDGVSRGGEIRRSCRSARRAAAVTAFLTVQEGCDKFCTFCVVPYTRGTEYSRSVADVEREARALLASGVREVTLLGPERQRLSRRWTGRPHLVAGRSRSRHLARIDGLERLRYTTSHPRDMSDDLIAAHSRRERS